MKFTPFTEDDIANDKPAFELLPEGEYDGVVVHSEEKISNAGNPYIFLKLMIYDREGRERIIFTNLALRHLFKHFCDTTGLQDKFNYGEINAEDCINKNVRALLKIEKGKLKDINQPELGSYKDKNVVADYIVKRSLAPSKLQPLKNEITTDEELPF